MAFNSKDTAAFKGVWVFCEQRDGVILGTGYQLLSEGRKLAPRPWAAMALTGCTSVNTPC